MSAAGMDFHARRFDRAADTYAAHSALQASMADSLMSLLPSHAPEAGPLVEFGCGTGLLTRRLSARFPAATFIVTDASPRMAAAAQASVPGSGRMRFSVCDASGRSPAPGEMAAVAPFALAASNALVQWFPDLGAHLAWTASLLAPGGAYLVSGFDSGNLPELNAILRSPPFGFSDFPGHSAGGLEALARRAGMGLEALREETRVEISPSPRALLDSIRALGASRRPREDRPLTRKRLELLLQAYQEGYPREAGVAATWKPWYALFRKP